MADDGICYGRRVKVRAPSSGSSGPPLIPYLLSDYTSAIRKEGKWTPGSYGGHDASRTDDSCGVLRFKATCSDGTLGAHMYQQGWNVSLYVYDDEEGLFVFHSTVATPDTSTWADTELFAGLDSGAEHTYQLLFSSVSDGGPGGAYVESVLVSSLNAATLAERDTIAFYGDSTIQGTQGTGHDSSKCDAMLIATALALACYNGGVGGTTVRNVSGTDDTAGESAARIAYLTTISPAPSHVLVRYGLNDSNQIKGPETEAEFESSYTAMMTALTAAMPDTVFLCETIIKAIGSADRTTWDAAISAAVAAVNTLNGNSKCVLVDISVWTEYTAQTTAPAQTTDGFHPTALGYSILFDRELPLFQVQLDPPTDLADAHDGTPFWAKATWAEPAEHPFGYAVRFVDSGSGEHTDTAASGSTSFTFTLIPPGTGTFYIRTIGNGTTYLQSSEVSVSVDVVE